MSDIPQKLRYTDSHEWVLDNGDGTATIGITDHAQEALGDVVFVELPEVDDEVAIGDEFGVVESVKAASDLYAPISCTILETNPLLEDSPEELNEHPYTDAWLVKVKIEDAGQLDDLLDAEAYTALVDSE